jgi:hypothetical protein
MGRKRVPGPIQRDGVWHIDKRIGGRRLMSADHDALIGPSNMALVAIVLAWAGENDDAVALVRRVINLPIDFPAWAMVRDPLLAVPLVGNPAFEALKREVDPPN